MLMGAAAHSAFHTSVGCLLRRREEDVMLDVCKRKSKIGCVIRVVVAVVVEVGRNTFFERVTPHLHEDEFVMTPIEFALNLAA